MVTPTTGQVATATTNDVTGARLVSRAPNDAYKDGWERIFGKKEAVPAEHPEPKPDKEQS